MRSERRWLLDGNLLTSLSIALGYPLTADFITKLPLAQGYNAILVVCNQFSKMTHFIATTERMYWTEEYSLQWE